MAIGGNELAGRAEDDHSQTVHENICTHLDECLRIARIRLADDEKVARCFEMVFIVVDVDRRYEAVHSGLLVSAQRYFLDRGRRDLVPYIAIEGCRDSRR